MCVLGKLSSHCEVCPALEFDVRISLLEAAFRVRSGQSERSQLFFGSARLSALPTIAG